MVPIIEVEELLALNPLAYILFDASAGSKARYDKNHLSGAHYIDLDTDLAEIGDFAQGGRHPLPTLQQFANTLTKFGVHKNSHVIIYDDKNSGNAAARFWWMLSAFGHEKVQVLNGGYQKALQVGFPNDDLAPLVPNEVRNYEISQWQLPLVEINEVELASKTRTKTIVDVRDTNRYAGLTEPIDLIAGHIPNAINIPFTSNLAEDGTFLPANILKEKYIKELNGLSATEVIVHCGSGVTACHMLLAMDYAGLAIPNLYIGSWSEWSRNNKAMILASS